MKMFPRTALGERSALEWLLDISPARTIKSLHSAILDAFDEERDNRYSFDELTQEADLHHRLF